LKDIKATDVEKWLKSLCFPRTGVPLARGSRAKIRNIMSALYSHAIRWEWTEKNPITSVRQSAKRQKAPDVLTPEEIMAFLKELPVVATAALALGFALGTWFAHIRQATPEAASVAQSEQTVPAVPAQQAAPQLRTKHH
jgi:integrase